MLLNEEQLEKLAKEIVKRVKRSASEIAAINEVNNMLHEALDLPKKGDWDDDWSQAVS